ncbi:hypothetical protein [Aeromonas jandaei]|uniref:hypothetical protein n=1 Tax=Aeromonas jandaei TaxID=650 RepID=UPI002B05E808|nr:hypothetical protein [Aeromonas jandaei]
MQVSVTHIAKIVLPKLAWLNPVTIYLENPHPGRGKITIECFRQSWSYSWSSMDGRRIEEFFISCDDEYLATCLSTCSSHIPVTEPSVLCAYLRKMIIQQRRAGELEKKNARRFWDESDTITLTSNYCSNTELMYGVLGDDWWLSLPQKENPDYNYLVRIIQAVREGLREYIKGTPFTGHPATASALRMISQLDKPEHHFRPSEWAEAMAKRINDEIGLPMVEVAMVDGYPRIALIHGMEKILDEHHDEAPPPIKSVVIPGTFNYPPAGVARNMEGTPIGDRLGADVGLINGAAPLSNHDEK